MMGRRILLAVIGAGDADEELASLAQEVGEGVAERGWVLLCGGLGGVMAAAARGARSRGGLTIGLLPGPDPATANPWIDLAIATDLGHARNALIARAADGLVAVGGGWGTLSEMALARKMGKPVVSLRSWRPAPDIPAADDPAETLALLERALAPPQEEGA